MTIPEGYGRKVYIHNIALLVFVCAIVTLFLYSMYTFWGPVKESNEDECMSTVERLGSVIESQNALIDRMNEQYRKCIEKEEAEKKDADGHI